MVQKSNTLRTRRQGNRIYASCTHAKKSHHQPSVNPSSVISYLPFWKFSLHFVLTFTHWKEVEKKLGEISGYLLGIKQMILSPQLPTIVTPPKLSCIRIQIRKTWQTNGSLFSFSCSPCATKNEVYVRGAKLITVSFSPRVHSVTSCLHIIYLSHCSQTCLKWPSSIRGLVLHDPAV